MGGGAWPILVGGVTRLVNFDNERDPSCLVGHIRLCEVCVSYMDCQYEAEGSFGLNQVCDALRHSRRHARYTGWKNVLLPSKGGVNHEFLPVNGIVCCNFRT